MKQCPQCSTEYDDNIKFCTRDGRSLITKTEATTRLCPHCANTIAADAANCPYCKAGFADPGEKDRRSRSFADREWPDWNEEVSLEGQWPEREDDSLEARLRSRKPRSSGTWRAVLVAGIVLCALGLFFFGDKFTASEQRSESQSMLEAKIKELEQTKIKELQDRDQKIEALEAELAQIRQKGAEGPNQMAALKTNLDKNQKELSASQQRLSVLTRELDESSRQRAALKTKLEETQRDLATSQQRLNIAVRELNRVEASRAQSNRVSAQTPAEPAPPAPARRAAEPGTYETIRVTTVHEDPSTSSRVIAQLGKGTKLTVVKSVGSWLEVRSRHGKPPGYIRLDDAIQVSAN